MELKTYLTADDYRDIKGIDLDEELRGSSDEEFGNADRMIYRVEKKLISFLKLNFGFDDIEELSHNDLENFKLAVADEIEDTLSNGITNQATGKNNSIIGENALNKIALIDYRKFQFILDKIVNYVIRNGGGDSSDFEVERHSFRESCIRKAVIAQFRDEVKEMRVAPENSVMFEQNKPFLLCKESISYLRSCGLLNIRRY